MKINQETVLHSFRGEKGRNYSVRDYFAVYYYSYRKNVKSGRNII